MDDGSHDSTATLLSQYEKEDDRVKIITNSTNIGIAKSLNKGMAVSRGTYIARMDSDDVSHLERIQAQVSFMRNNHHIGVLGTAVDILYQDGSRKVKILPCDPTLCAFSLVFYCSLVHPSVMFRRDAISDIMDDECRIYNEDEIYLHAEDYQLWLRLRENGVGLANLPDVLLTLRKHEGNVSSVFKDRQKCSSVRCVYIYLHDVLDINGVQEQIVREIQDRQVRDTVEAIELLEKVEEAFLTRFKVDEVGLQLVKEDISNRMGELCMLSMSSDVAVAANMLQKWMLRKGAS